MLLPRNIDCFPNPQLKPLDSNDVIATPVKIRYKAVASLTSSLRWQKSSGDQKHGGSGLRLGFLCVLDGDTTVIQIITIFHVVNLNERFPLKKKFLNLLESLPHPLTVYLHLDKSNNNIIIL